MKKEQELLTQLKQIAPDMSEKDKQKIVLFMHGKHELNGKEYLKFSNIIKELEHISQAKTKDYWQRTRAKYYVAYGPGEAAGQGKGNNVI